jgi:hypothetical protein
MTIVRVGGAAICLVAASLSELSTAETSPPPATSAPSASSSVAPPASSAEVPIPSSSSSAPAPPIPAILQSATGTPVEFHSDRPHVSVFVASGIIEDTEPRYPDPFVKVGRTPVSTKLAPGVYTVTVESADIAVSSRVFQVGTEPVHVLVRGGNSEARNLGTLLMGLGAAGLLGALAVEVSYSSAPNGISKAKIAIPLLVGGGISLAGGLAIYLSAGTTIEPDGPKPDRRGAIVGVTSRW